MLPTCQKRTSNLLETCFRPVGNLLLTYWKQPVHKQHFIACNSFKRKAYDIFTHVFLSDFQNKPIFAVNFYLNRIIRYVHGSLKKTKKIRIHREGTHTLAVSLCVLLGINIALYAGIENKVPFYIVAVISLVVYGILVNFFRCPIRLFGKETEKVVVAPADGKIVVVEEVEENEYFHDRRIMISIS